jgi:hypothetical protein
MAKIVLGIDVSKNTLDVALIFDNRKTLLNCLIFYNRYARQVHHP